MNDETKRLIKNGFSYSCSYTSKKNEMRISFSVLYQDEEIYFQLLNPRVDCEILFINVCKSYIRDSKLNQLGI